MADTTGIKILSWSLFGVIIFGIMTFLFVKIDVVKQCQIFRYDSKLALGIKSNDSKYITIVNQKAKLKYGELNYWIYLTYENKKDDIAVYDFYSTNQTNFDYGISNGLIDFGNYQYYKLFF